MLRKQKHEIATDLVYKAEQGKIGQLFPFSSVHITILTQCLENQYKGQCTITNGEDHQLNFKIPGQDCITLNAYSHSPAVNKYLHIETKEKYLGVFY